MTTHAKFISLITRRIEEGQPIQDNFTKRWFRVDQITAIRDSIVNDHSCVFMTMGVSFWCKELTAQELMRRIVLVQEFGEEPKAPEPKVNSTLAESIHAVCALIAHNPACENAWFDRVGRLHDMLNRYNGPRPHAEATPRSEPKLALDHALLNYEASDEHLEQLLRSAAHMARYLMRTMMANQISNLIERATAAEPRRSPELREALHAVLKRNPCVHHSDCRDMTIDAILAAIQQAEKL